MVVIFFRLNFDLLRKNAQHGALSSQILLGAMFPLKTGNHFHPNMINQNKKKTFVHKMAD